MSREFPILFSGEMVRALLAGRKTVTRRKIGHKDIDAHPDKWEFRGMEGNYANFFNKENKSVTPVKCRYGAEGDVLWVREGYTIADALEYNKPAFLKPNSPEWAYYYAADFDRVEGKDIRWKPSIHMPREAARLFLRRKGPMRVERLHDITVSEIEKEGIEKIEMDQYETSASVRFIVKSEMERRWKHLWMEINGEESYELNPWLWVVDFDVYELDKG